MQSRLPLLLACLLGFGLGCVNLGTRALWGDETYSVFAARLDWPVPWRGIDTSPPLYYSLLKLLLPISGHGEYALRLPSVWASVLALCLLAGGLRSHARAWAGLMLACSPLLVYMAQEARMYALGLLWVAVVWRAFIGRVAGERTPAPPPTLLGRGWGWGPVVIAYATTSLAAALTHLYTLGPLFAIATLWLLRVLQRRAALRPWLIAHALWLPPFAAWFVLAMLPRLQAEASGRGNALPGLTQLLGHAQAGIGGLLLGPRPDAWLLLPAAALVLASAAIALRRRVTWPTAWLTAVCIVLALLTSAVVPAFSARYFYFAVPSFCLLLAVGFAHLRWGRLLLAVLLLLQFVSVRFVWDSTWTKSRYDQLWATIRTQARPDDMVILLNPVQRWPFDYYGDPTLRSWWVDDAADASALTVQTAGATRVWLISYGALPPLSPGVGVANVLEQAVVRTYRAGFDDASLSLHVLGAPVFSNPASPLDEKLGDSITLRSARLNATTVRAGDVIAAELLWSASQRPTHDYTVFVHLRRLEDDAQLTANDSAPLRGTRPTSSWQVGEQLRDVHGLGIPLDAPPGAYRVVVGLYAWPSLARLQLPDGGTEVEAGRFEVR